MKDQIKEALEFYANKEHHTLQKCSNGWHTPVLSDAGEMAHEALTLLTAPEAQEMGEGWRLVSDEREHGRIIIGYAIVDTATGNWNQHLMSWNKYDNKWAGWPEHMAQPTHWQPLPKPPKDGGE